jgi:hypothetical protein
VEANVAKKLVSAKIKDLVGGMNVLGAKGERQENPSYVPDPSFLQLRQVKKINGKFFFFFKYNFFSF